MGKPLFAECKKCEARWQICTVPIPIATLAKVSGSLLCPNCNATIKDISLCHTDGPHAVTESRGPQKEHTNAKA
jgi:hypothetical protein